MKRQEARCFLTGVGFDMESAFVLNRREAIDLLAKLKGRVASLQRIVEQFSPLDDIDVSVNRQAWRPPHLAPKTHRLVCKAVADAMGVAFPEIELFEPWPQYQARVKRVMVVAPVPTAPLTETPVVKRRNRKKKGAKP